MLFKNEWLAEKVNSGAAFMIVWCYGRIKWLAYKVYGDVTFARN